MKEQITTYSTQWHNPRKQIFEKKIIFNLNSQNTTARFKFFILVS